VSGCLHVCLLLLVSCLHVSSSLHFLSWFPWQKEEENEGSLSLMRRFFLFVLQTEGKEVRVAHGDMTRVDKMSFPFSLMLLLLFLIHRHELCVTKKDQFLESPFESAATNLSEISSNSIPAMKSDIVIVMRQNKRRKLSGRQFYSLPVIGISEAV
jgi:hypothetical protein